MSKNTEVPELSADSEIQTQTQTNNTAGYGLGARLKATREEKGLTLDAVSSELCILKRHLEAIERNDHDNLPQAAFTRGFIGSYAKLLKLDVKSVLAEYDQTLPAEKRNHETSFSEGASLKPMGKLSRNDSAAVKNSPGGLFRLALIASLLALAAFGFFYFTNKGNSALISGESDQTTSVLDGMLAQDGANQDGLNEEGAVDAESEQAVSTQAQSEPAEADEQLDQESITDQQTQSVVADPNAPDAELVFWVMSDSSIKITDQKGAVIMNGSYSRGEHRASGQPPFKLNISNAANVRLNMNTIPQNQAIRSRTQPDGSAKLVLAP